MNKTTLEDAAAETADTLWDGCVSSYKLTLKIATLCQTAENDFKKAGEALAIAWARIGGDIPSAQSTRQLVEACHGTTMAKKEASKFLNAMALVSKQRVSQLLSVVYDGDASKNRGNTKDEKSQDGLDKGKGFTFEQILAAIGSLQSITKEQAQAAAQALASKIA